MQGPIVTNAEKNQECFEASSACDVTHRCQTATSKNVNETKMKKKKTTNEPTEPTDGHTLPPIAKGQGDKQSASLQSRKHHNEPPNQLPKRFRTIKQHSQPIEFTYASSSWTSWRGPSAVRSARRMGISRWFCGLKLRQQVFRNYRASFTCLLVGCLSFLVHRIDTSALFNQEFGDREPVMKCGDV
jgi:hypothetical protein